jgi:GNAT superfamily N-acetyltransferase
MVTGTTGGCHHLANFRGIRAKGKSRSLPDKQQYCFRKKDTMIRIRPMTLADIPFGLCLSRQAGWNQTEVHWQRLVDFQEDGCFVGERQGKPVATTTTSIFGPVAWIAMVLVEESLRGRGIGKALLEHALEFLAQRGITTVRLDATPLGQPLYERLGFVQQYGLARHEGILRPAPDVAGVEPATPDQWPALIALDHKITATHRRRLLDQRFTEQPEAVRLVRQSGQPIGFLTSRPGARAIQIGPCIASPDAGRLLFADAWHRHAGQRVFVDIPLLNEAATTLTQAQGLTVQRHLTRMCRGIPVCERLDFLWASSGPEKG